MVLGLGCTRGSFSWQAQLVLLSGIQGKTCPARRQIFGTTGKITQKVKNA
jgi:hypothetical protein